MDSPKGNLTSIMSDYSGNVLVKRQVSGSGALQTLQDPPRQVLVQVWLTYLQEPYCEREGRGARPEAGPGPQQGARGPGAARPGLLRHSSRDGGARKAAG